MWFPEIAQIALKVAGKMLSAEFLGTRGGKVLQAELFGWDFSPPWPVKQLRPTCSHLPIDDEFTSSHPAHLFSHEKHVGLNSPLELKALIPTKLTQRVVGREVRMWLNNTTAVLIFKKEKKKKWANKCYFPFNILHSFIRDKKQFFSTVIFCGFFH